MGVWVLCCVGCELGELEELVHGDVTFRGFGDQGSYFWVVVYCHIIEY